jgi:signal transduction histidine kinase
MTKRLLLSYLTITVFVLVVLELPLAVFYGQRERDRIEADAGQDANVLATVYEDALEQGLEPDPGPADSYRERTGARIVVVGTDGISVVDTDQAPGRDFSTRPEIVEALGGNRNSGARRSDTLGTDLLYVAVPVASSGVVHGAVRLTIDTQFVTDRIHRFWLALAGVAAVVLAVVGVAGWVLARSVTRPVRHLRSAAARFAGGDLTIADVPAGGVPELRSLAEAMNTMAERLDALITAQRSFVADASHQLRTPLTSIRLQVENIQNQVADGDVPAPGTTDAVLDEIDRLTAIVADMLRLARAEAHPGGLHGDRHYDWLPNRRKTIAAPRQFSAGKGRGLDDRRNPCRPRHSWL